MKQVININFQGRVVPIEVTAFDILKRYTESLNRHFANEEGKDEIINDIESRIGELFQERLTKGATCITDDDVNAVIKSMGRPEDFENDEETASNNQSNDQTKSSESSSGNYQYSNTTATHKRLYRDENNKVLGGVCSGIANYFGIDTTLVRILFILTGFGLLAYILLWIFVPSNSGTVIGGVRKKLYRDGEDKIVAGVCSGIGNYFGINPWIPRVLFLLPFLSFAFGWSHWGMLDFPHFLRLGFSPGSLIVYIILWMVLPEAVTTAEKLEMKGEKVDMNSIKESVKEEMKGFQQRAEKFGKEAKQFAEEKGKTMGAEFSTVAKRSGRSFGDIILFFFKFFAYFIIGIVGFSLLITLFALGMVSIGIFPLKDFLINDGWQNIYAWGTLLFFIAVPIIGIITWIIRKIARAKGHSKIIRLSFGSLWVVGWVCMILLVSSVAKEFSHSNKMLTEQEIILSNPKVNKLEITSNNPLEKYRGNHWFRFEPFAGLDEDTAYVKNFDIRIMKSSNDSFRVTVIKMAMGKSRDDAERNADLIQFNGLQKDSILQLDKGIAINTTNKFRNQSIVLTIYVPVGKHIIINRSIGWHDNIHIHPFRNRDNDFWDIDYNDESHDWNSDIEYIMNADGHLYSKDGKQEGRQKINHVRINENGITINSTNRDENYRYPNTAPINKLDSMKLKLQNEQQRIKDSLEKAKEKIDQQLEKLNDNNNDEPSALNLYKVPGYGLMMTIN